MTLKYRNEIQNFCKITRLVFLIGAILLAGVLLFPISIGFKGLAGIGIIIYLLLAFKLHTSINKEIEIDTDTITSIQEKGDTLIINYDNKQIKLNELLYDENDLLNILGMHELEYLDDDSFFDSSIFTYVLLGASVVSLLFVFGTFMGLYRHTFIVMLGSLVLPLIIFIFYLLMFKENKLDQIGDNRAFFMMSLIISTLGGWAALYLRYASTPTIYLVITAIIIVVSAYVFYSMKLVLLQAVRDWVIIIFLLMYIPLALISINNVVSLESKSYDVEIASTSESNSRFTFYYADVVINDKNVHINISEDEYSKYKKGDTVKVSENKGIFGITTYELES